MLMICLWVILTQQLILPFIMDECDKKTQQEWWPGHVAKGCLMISLDNEMHMSIVDVIQIKRIRKNNSSVVSAFPVQLHFLVWHETKKIQNGARCLECHARTDQ